MKIAAMMAGLLALTPGGETAFDEREAAGVASTLDALVVLADRGDFTALETVFTGDVLVDYSQLCGGTPERVSNSALMTRWAGVLPGFDRTRHDLSNMQVSVQGDTARAQVDLIASHWLDDQIWVLQGGYDVALLKEGEDWRISALTLIVTGESGDRGLLERAGDRAAIAPAPYIQRQQTRAAVRQFLTGLETHDMAMLNDVWAEDAVQQMPYAPEGFPSQVSGREALIAHYSGWPTNAGAARFTHALVFHDMLDPSRVFAEFHGEADILPTGRRYDQRYGGVFVVEDGKIALFREYFNPDPFRYAFGLEEGGAFN